MAGKEGKDETTSKVEAELKWTVPVEREPRLSDGWKGSMSGAGVTKLLDKDGEREKKTLAWGWGGPGSCTLPLPPAFFFLHGFSRWLREKDVQVTNRNECNSHQICYASAHPVDGARAPLESHTAFLAGIAA